jgi:hypothetical protein
MSKDWQKEINEQEGREFWGKPTRHTTIDNWHKKISYEEFIDYTKRWDLQENLRDGDRFIENWMELFCAYHEIEQGYPEEEGHRNRAIDDAVEAQLRWEEYQKNATT